MITSFLSRYASIFFTFPLLSLMFMTIGTPVKKVKIIFFGDSITQLGVNKGGYIDLVQSTVNQKRLQDQYELIGAGIGGNKVYDLYLRMEDDVLSKNPDRVVVYIGINDVWHKSSHGTGTDIDKYEKFYAAIIKKLQARHIDVLLCTPTVIGELKNNANPQDTDLEAYSGVVRKLADAYGCILVDLRKIFTDYEKAHNSDNQESGILTTDRVHLNEKGNKVVADAMTTALSIQ